MTTSSDDVGRGEALTIAERIALFAQAREIVGVWTLSPGCRPALRSCSMVLTTMYLAELRPRHEASRPMYATMVCSTVRSIYGCSDDLAVQWVEREQAYRAALSGQSDSLTFAARCDTAWVYAAVDRVDDGLVAAQAIVTEAARSPDPDNPNMLRSKVCLAISLSRAGRPAAAAELCQQVLATFQSGSSAQLDIELTRIALGLIQLAAGRPGTATALFESAAAAVHQLFRRTSNPEAAQELDIPAACLCRFTMRHGVAISGPSRRPLRQAEPSRSSD
ncbi:hypothetical protein [Nocardia seriolae]|nr:hypothetical protein [Nocardia seriolae]QOW34956.1 hypothetical protein IMZ23_08180 [Nocardia seriolae]QUN17579.1 hypothetical protein KEC46_36810 [Nocardia seriolae]WNJ62204.1 hypothetical protein RMO66_16865 [Nocardia seriolae]